MTRILLYSRKKVECALWALWANSGKGSVYKTVIILSHFIQSYCYNAYKRRKKKVGMNGMKRVAAGAHLPNPWMFPACETPRR